MNNCKDITLISCLCKDIARHASQLEAECQGVNQSVDRYLELKSLLLSHFLHNGHAIDVVINEIQKSLNTAGGWDNKGDVTVSVKNHALCLLNYFMMLMGEMDKEE